MYNTYLKVAKPAPAPPPTVAFGKLPQMAFPEKLHPELTLRLETPTGGTPNLGDRATVMLMPQSRPSFTALDEAKATANRLSFRNEPRRDYRTAPINGKQTNFYPAPWKWILSAAVLL